MNGRGLADRLDLASALFAGAPLEPDGWEKALREMTHIAGGWGAQLLAHSPTQLRFNLCVDVPEEAVRAYEAAGAADPTLSPRLYAGLHGPLMGSVADSDDLAPEVRRRARVFEAFYDVYDAQYACSGRLPSRDGLHVAVASLRAKSAGEFEPAERQAFEALLPHIRSAFDVQMTIEGNAMALALGAFDAISMVALVCDAYGKLLACSPSGEAFLRKGEFLTLSKGVVSPSALACQPDFARALAIAAAPVDLSTPANSTVILRGPSGKGSRRLEVAPFRTEFVLGLGRAVLLALPASERAPDPRGLAQLGLTPAEAEVALATASGRTPAEIAAARGVGYETVRSQIRSIYAKLDVHSAVQLAARLADDHV
jgi:DNA-binding CsgD family transcriptional regulator